MTDQPTAPAAPAAGAPPAAPAGSPSAAAAPAGASGTPWHAGFDPTIKSFLENKKYDLSDPVKVVDVMARSYQGAERLLGVPADELLRLPKPNADTTEVNGFWNRVGVPKEAKDYDFSQIKTAGGEAPDQALVDALRTSLHANRVPKENAPAVLRDVVKYLDSIETEVNAAAAAEIQRQNQWLDQNWGNRKAYNMTVAKDALDRIGAAAGLTKEQIDQGWDALSKQAGIGASYAMEMLRTIGARMGEHDFVSGGQGRPAGDQGAMSQDQARAEIRALLQDRDFQQRLLNKNVEALRKWTNLHQVAAGVQTVAA